MYSYGVGPQFHLLPDCVSEMAETYANGPADIDAMGELITPVTNSFIYLFIFLMPLQPLEQCLKHSVLGLSMCASNDHILSLLTRYLINYLCQFPYLQLLCSW